MESKHALRGIIRPSAERVVDAGINDTDLRVTFNVKVDGENDPRFTRVARAYYWQRDQGTGPGRRFSLDAGAPFVSVRSTGNGNYEAVFPGLGPAGALSAASTPGTTLMLTVDTGNGPEAATVVAHVGGTPNNFVVTNQSCEACHGDKIFRLPEGPDAPEHHGASPKGVESCVVCHNRIDTIGPGLGAADAGTGLGSRLMGYVHGIHASKGMPGGQVAIRFRPTGGVEQWFNVGVDAGIYLRTVSSGPDGGPVPNSTFSVGYPSYVNNCSTCHNTPATLARANNAPTTWATCMSCHQNWDGFSAFRGVTTGLAATHKNITAANVTTTTCTTGCHVAGGIASGKVNVASYHNGRFTERAGLIFDGDDQSVELGKTVRMAITGVGIDGGSQAIRWTAEQNVNGTWTPVNPCNTDVSSSAPLFFGYTADAGAGLAASNTSILRAYAQANDWVNAGLPGSTSPGQPGNAVNVTTANTTCAANVATTVVPAETTSATLAIVSVQGKPVIRFPQAPAGSNYQYIQLRSPSPTYEFDPRTGAVATTKRRNLVAIEKCNSCHEGSMYQHGGNRIDSIDLCEMCHNPAANEKNRRVGYGVDATEAYDGKSGESYDLRYMVHAIHSAGETGEPLVYYRTNGIYFFGNNQSLAATPTWPGSGCQNVSGAITTDAGTSGGNCGFGRAPHNYIEIHYPRSLADCTACHDPGTVQRGPDPTQAVALTVDPGAAPWNNLNDDTLIGPTAASCMSCHQSGNFIEQYYLRSHAYDFGITPGVYANGRQTLLDAVTDGGIR